MIHTLSSHDTRMMIRFAPLAALVILLSACGISGDSVDTVDSAVTLLQDLEDVGVWGVLDDNLDALDAYDGYRATVTLQNGLLDAEGVITDPETTTLIIIQVDAAGIAQITIEQDGQTQQIMAFPQDSDDGDDPTFLIVEHSGEGYTCADEAATALFVNGPQSLFDAAGFKRAAQATLSVVEKDGDSTIIDREATHYLFESRLEDALDILGDTENDSLREQVEQADHMTLEGTLDLDKDTLVPLYFEGTTRDSSAQTWATLVYEITQWGDIPTFDRPADDSLPVCE